MYSDFHEDAELGEQCDWMSCILGMYGHFSPLYPRLDLGSSLSLKMVPACFSKGTMACV
jgi:hypothetical protein